ncbi:MAG: CapA family protein [Lentisphaeria bacterium]|nr:CapA family protein [Candidatus Neomarinimicrobiota bacterium]MCF7842610.1 CapA family protein [Lentisphaeria bacterium]
MKRLILLASWTILSFGGLFAEPVDSDTGTGIDTIAIMGVGDIMLGTNFPDESYLPPKGVNLLEPLAMLTRNAHVTVGNLEGTFLDSGGVAKQCDDSTRCYAFRQPTEYARYLVDAGFDLLNLANNHSGDFSDLGRFSTIATLDQHGIGFAGYAIWPDTVVVRHGVRFGFAGFAPNKGTVGLHKLKAVSNRIERLKKRSDVVIVAVHAGAEGDSAMHVPRATEWYLGENRGDVYKFAHAVVDAGADVVFGSGPHVTRGVELYRDRLIAYSLGNYCTYARFNFTGRGKHGPVLRVLVDQQGKFLAGQVFAIKQPGRGGPVFDPDGLAIEEMRILSQEDFPESPLMIDSTGRILRSLD